MFWDPYILKAYDHTQFEQGMVVLDLGCGDGTQLKRLSKVGCKAVGLDPDRGALPKSWQHDFWVGQGVAEELPFRHRAFDGVLCKGVLPYTDERRAVGEIGRVLRPRGVVQLMSVGAGYYLRYLLLGPSWRARFYGGRALVNTWFYALTGWQLPGFLGDTIYQSRARLQQTFEQNQLEVIDDTPAPTFLRRPVLIYQRLRRRG